MKKVLLIAIAIWTLVSCFNAKKGNYEDRRKVLRTDTLNVVKLTDTLVIFENTCRGCAFENSTDFNITDSTGTVKLYDIETYDANEYAKEPVAGGSIDKTLVIVPQKTGVTKIKLYKAFEGPVRIDSTSRFTYFSIEVKN